MSETLLKARLDALAATGRVVRFWLRDDDAVEPTPALDQLLTLTRRFRVPLALAVIPEPTGEALADHLRSQDHVTVTVHGWSHRSYAPPGEKKRELGLHRPASVVLGELKEGLDKLSALHGPRLQPMLVPPWNRIDAALLPALPDLGYRALSVFGREDQRLSLACLNTHVDVMDWHGTRGGRDADVLFAEIAGWLTEGSEPPGAIGILTHHLVHDAAVWTFLERLFALTSGHPACQWMGVPELLASP